MAYFEVNKKPPLSFPTLTGSIVTFNAQYAGLPLKSHKVNIDSVSGVSAINISATGKNLLDIPNIEVNGATSPYEFWGKSGVAYCVSFDADVSGIGINAQFRSADNASVIAQSGVNSSDSSRNVINITLPDDSYKFRFYSAGRINISNVQIAIGSNNSLYEAYNGKYITINIGQTVNEGEYNARTGVLEVTQPSVQTLQLPPCPIDTLLGENNIWADTGDTTLQYPKFG